MNGLMLRLNIMAFVGLFLAAPFAVLYLLAGYYPGAFGMGLAATLCAMFLGAQLVIWAKPYRASAGRHAKTEKQA